MKIWTAFLPFVFLFSGWVVQAQSRTFASGRLISREVRVTSNCIKAADLPPVQSMGPGLSIPIPQLTPCDYTYANGVAADPKPTLRYTVFTIDHPLQTPPGTMTPSASGGGAIAFAQPLTAKLTTSANWELNAPVGQDVGTHAASYENTIEGDPASSCAGSATSAAPIGALGFDAACSVSTTVGAWNASAGTATLTITTNVGFRFGNNNGLFNIIVRATYGFSRLDIDHIEVLQTVQTADNSVPLVAGKRALVRVFPVSSAAGAAQIRLKMFRGDELLQTFESGAVPVGGGAPVRSDLSKSANFLIPAAMALAGPVRFEAEIREPQRDYTGKATLNATFQPAPGWTSPYPVVFATLCDSSTAGCPPGATAGALAQAEFLLPAERLSIYSPRFDVRSPMQALLTAYRLRAAIESETALAQWPQQYIVHDLNPDPTDPLCPDGSCAISDPFAAPGQRKIGYVGGPAANMVACVIGANLGLMRQPGAIVDPSVTAGGTLLDPSAADIMSCLNSNGAGTAGISASNALGLFNAYGSKPGGPKATDPVYMTLISGALRADESAVSFDPLYNVRSLTDFGASQGAYCLRISKAGASAGPDVCFDIPQSVGGADRPFAVRTILPDGVDRIALVTSGNELGLITKSASWPSVQITSPADGAALTARNLNISWNATDADSSGPLQSQVWVSTDGGQNWMPAALDLTGSQFTLDTSRFSGADTLYVQVRVSDGFNDTSATAGPIALNAAPALDQPAAVRLPDTRVGEGRIVLVPINNTGGGPLRITAVESTLASLSYAGSPLPLVIPAQQSYDLPVQFLATGAGPVSATLTIRNNDSARPAAVVPVTGTVFTQTGPAAEANAIALDFGAVNLGATSDQKVRITNRGSETLNLSNIAVNPLQVFRVTGASNAAVEPGAFTEITIRCAPSNGAFTPGTLTAATNDPARPQISLAAGCSGVSPSLEVPTGGVDFGTVANGQSRTQQIIIRNITSQAIVITGAVFTNAQYRLVTPPLPLSIAAGASRTLDIQFSPTVGGVAVATLTLTTNNDAVSAQIALRGTGTGSNQTNGKLTYEPSQLVFGDVVINQSRTLTLTLRNTGTGLLTVTKIESNNPAFAVTGITIPASIGVGAFVEAQIRFSPTTTSSFNSVLTISSDNVVGSDDRISMTGSGLPIASTTVSTLSAPLRQDFASRAFLVSFGPDDAILRFVRFDASGTQVGDTGLTIPAGSQLRPDLDSGAGWAQVRVSRGSVEGYLQYAAQQAQTFDVLPLTSTLATKLLMTGLERGSDIILNNLISDNNPVILELRTNNGAVVGTQNVTLGNRAALTQRVEQLFPNAPQGFQGYLVITAALGLQATRTNNGATAMEISAAQPLPASAASNTVLYAPRLQAGNGWLARLQVVNPTDRDARIVIRAAASDGGTISTPVEVTLAAGSAYWREFTQMYDLSGNVTWNASLTVQSDVKGLVGELSYGNSFARAAYALTSMAAKQSVIPTNTASTGFYILNPNATPVFVDLRNQMEDGSFGTGRRVTIPKGGFYGGPSGLIQSPSVRIEADQPVVAHATVTADQVLDFGILPAISLDGSSGGGSTGNTPRLQVDPPTLDFGSVLIGQNRALTLSIRNGGGSVLSVTSLSSSNARYTVEGPLLPLTIQPGSTQQVQVRFSPTATGPQTGVLTVNSNDTVTGPVTVGLNGSGTASDAPKVRIDVTSLPVDFGDVNSGQTKDLLLDIRNGGTDPLIVSRVDITNPRFQLVAATFPLTVQPSSLASIKVRFSPAVAGVQTGTLTLVSNDPANPAANVALRGNGVGTASSPIIKVSVDSLAFGVVSVGQTGEGPFEIRNTGTAPLIIQALTLDNPAYSIGLPVPFTVSANAIADVNVVFRPRAPGDAPATLRIVTNDPVNGTIVIPITGAGR